MYNILDFIRWALTHVDPSTVPSGAQLARPVSECGTDPWHYLFGTVRVYTNDLWLTNRWEQYYKTHGYPTRESFDAVTIGRGWKSTDRATDCEGLLDAWLTYEENNPTDNNAAGNYANWCTDKGKISDIHRAYQIGEAVFRHNGEKIVHVGWTCGFLGDEPLVVEAAGIQIGVVITRLNHPLKSWTHRGLMTKIFDYSAATDPVVFKLTSPRMQGADVLALQEFLNGMHYKYNGTEILSADGKLGPKTYAVLQDFVNANRDAGSDPKVIDTFHMSEGGYTITVSKE